METRGENVTRLHADKTDTDQSQRGVVNSLNVVEVE